MDYNAVKLNPYENGFTLVVYKTKVNDLLKAADGGGMGKDLVYTLNIGSAGLKKTFPVKVVFTGKKTTYSISFGKQQIDIANPDSYKNVTIKLKNTSAKIKEVILYESMANEIPWYESGDFKTKVTGANTFVIMASHKEVVPNLEQKLSLLIRLDDGQALKSWTEPDLKGKNKDKPVKVKPIQGKGKATQTKKAVTLYRASPLYGESLGIDLTAPANAKIGAVSIDPESLKPFATDDGFRLERKGEKEFTVHFAKDAVPVDKNGKQASSGSSYDIRLQIWAEGTYRYLTDSYGNLVLDASGNRIPAALENGKAKSNPTPITIRVNLR
jgi:hypothetical protein